MTGNDQRRADRDEVHGARPLERLAQRGQVLRRRSAADHAHRRRPQRGRTGGVRRTLGLAAPLDRLARRGHRRRHRARRHRHAEQRPRRAGDRRARGRQARRLREAARRHAGRRRGDGRRRGGAARHDVRLVQLPPRAGRRAGPPAGRRRRARPDLPRPCRATCRAGAGPTRRCCGGSRATSPGRARTATSTRTSSTPSGSSPARRSRRSRARSSTRSSRNAQLLVDGAGGEIAGSGAATVGGDGREHRRRRGAVPRPAQRRRNGERSRRTRLATGYHNANRFEIHGERGALRFDFERMNELELLRRHRRRSAPPGGRRST